MGDRHTAIEPSALAVLQHMLYSHQHQTKPQKTSGPHSRPCCKVNELKMAPARKRETCYARVGNEEES